MSTAGLVDGPQEQSIEMARIAAETKLAALGLFKTIDLVLRGIQGVPQSF
jgi:hypothetical protein